MDRERGATGASCSNCGSDVPLVAQPDGSVAAQPCQACFGPSTPVAVRPVPVESNPKVDEGEKDEEAE